MIKKTITNIFLFLVLTACIQEDIPLVNLGLDDVYVAPRMIPVHLQPAYTGERYQWTMKTTAGNDSILTTDKDYIFLEANPGVYNLTFNIFDPTNPIQHDLQIYIVEEEVEYSPYLSHVYDYCPAPGQFINTMPLYEEGDTKETMRKKAEEAISGKNEGGISLGSFGGYITFGFDHTVVNVKGQADFSVSGNAFNSAAHPGQEAGSCEPGIVLVSFDFNKNGKPDDKWYEIDKYQWYTNEIATFGYEITYYKPDPNRDKVVDGALIDVNYIRWVDNKNNTGYVHKNQFHDQDYFPKWDSQDTWTFRGTLLPKNAVDVSGNGTYYLQYMFPYGAYVDNYPLQSVDKDGINRSSFDIDWAVDIETRERVHLPGVDFIRVYTALNQYCGWLGETSTEIYQARDLHVYVRPTRPGE